MNDICCLFTKGKGLNDPARDLLYHTAFFMIRKSRDKCRIDGHGVNGEITTKGEHTGLGGTFGQKFRAELDSEDGGRQTVEFIVRTQTEEGDGNWHTLPPHIAAQIVGGMDN